MLINRAKLLENAGCTINAIACNTAHILLPELEANTSLNFINLPKIVSCYISHQGFTRVGLLATPTTLQSDLYDAVIDPSVTITRPSDELARSIEQVTHRQLDEGLLDDERESFQRVVDNFRRYNKLDAVILGCTELPLVYGESDNPRVIDSLKLLANETLKQYYCYRR